MKKLTNLLLASLLLFGGTVHAQSSNDEEKKSNAGLIYTGVMGGAAIFGLGYLYLYKIPKAKKEAAEKKAKREALAKARTLEGKQVLKLEILYSNTVSIAPKKQLRINISAELKDKTKLRTNSEDKVHTSWEEYSVRVKGAKFRNGMLYFGGRDSFPKQHFFTVEVVNKYHPKLKSTKKIWFNYKGKFEVGFKGEKR